MAVLTDWHVVGYVKFRTWLTVEQELTVPLLIPVGSEATLVVTIKCLTGFNLTFLRKEFV
jgi:hypothetical protein